MTSQAANEPLNHATEATTNLDEPAKIAEKRPGLNTKLEKPKAGHEMMSYYIDNQYYGAGDITGPDAGYSSPYGYYHAITTDGWAYELRDNSWYLLPDGCIGWRRGNNPFPEIQ